MVLEKNVEKTQNRCFSFLQYIYTHLANYFIKQCFYLKTSMLKALTQLFS